MTDKSNFTPDEWKLLLESVTMAGIAITAAEPHGLWGLLKESFAGGSALVQAKLDPGANPLIKAVVADFNSDQGRATARGLKEKLKGVKSADIPAKCIEGREGAGRCSRVQELVASDQPTRCRSSQGRRIFGYRWCDGKRSREGNPYGDLQRA